MVDDHDHVSSCGTQDPVRSPAEHTESPVSPRDPARGGMTNRWWPEPIGPARVIVPIVATTARAAETQARAIASTDAELVEWRADGFAWSGDMVVDAATAVAVAARLRAIVGRPLIFTWRTRDEGGQAPEATDDMALWALTGAVADARAADLVDVEIRHPLASGIIERARRAEVPVIGSWHDIHGTPPADAIVATLAVAEAAGASVAKVAVMPVRAAGILEALRAPDGPDDDVATLLTATKMRAAVARIPLVTMSMGRKGLPSRVVGWQFGSQATWATVGPSSAPGQPTLKDLRQYWAASGGVATDLTGSGLRQDDGPQL